MSEEKPFQLDKKELCADVPLMARPVVGSLIDWLNKADLNHDGKADLSQAAPFFFRAMPVILELAPLVDWEALLGVFLAKFTKDQPAAKVKVDKLAALASEYQKANEGVA